MIPHRNRVIRVLSCSTDESLLSLRAAILQNAGCSVISSQSPSDALFLLDSEPFEVLLLGHTLSKSDRDNLSRVFRRRSPDGRIVAVLAGTEGLYEGDTDEVVHGLDGPGALVRAVLGSSESSASTSR